VDDVIQIISNMKVGETMPILISRHGKHLTLHVRKGYTSFPSVLLPRIEP